MVPNKPIVKCALSLGEEFLEVGGRALVYPINHPNHLPGHQVSNTKDIVTSTIINIDLVNNKFETQNTIYNWVDI